MSAESNPKDLKIWKLSIKINAIANRPNVEGSRIRAKTAKVPTEITFCVILLIICHLTPETVLCLRDVVINVLRRCEVRPQIRWIPALNNLISPSWEVKDGTDHLLNNNHVFNACQCR